VFKWRPYCTQMTNLSQFTINVRKIPTVSFNSLCHSCAKDEVSFLPVSVDIHASLCEWQHPKCQPAVRLVYLPFFCKLHSSSKPTTKILITALDPEVKNSSSPWPELDACSYELSPPTILTLLPERPYIPLLLSITYSTTMGFLSVDST